MKRFEFIVTKGADRSRPKNGNNSNYDKVAIFFDGHFMTDNFISDFTRNTSTFVRTNMFDTTYEIVDGRVVETMNGEKTDITDLILADEYSPYKINDDVRKEISMMNTLRQHFKEAFENVSD